MAEDQTPLLGGNWALFAQPDGPNTEPEYLGCHDFDDMDKDEGDITLTYCPDPAKPNSWLVTGSYRGEESPATTTITTSIRKTKDILTTVVAKGCGIPLYLLDICSGRKDVFANWDSQALLLYRSFITSRGWQGLAKRVPGDQTESTRSFDISIERVYEPFMPGAERQTIGETTALNDIVFCNSEKCADACGAAEDVCETGYIVTDAPTGSPTWDADVWTTADKGANWSEIVIDPFGPAEDIASVVCFQVDKDTTRVVVARGTADAGNPAEIAYTDDGGATWNLVDVGSTNGQFAQGPGSLFAIDENNIWLVTNGGYIYFSDDGALTWETQEDGTATANDLNYIHGSDENNLMVVGDSDTVLYTTTGGLTWTAATATGGGNDLLTVHVKNNPLDAWVGDSGGDAYYTDDRGTTWTQRAFSGDGVGEVHDIAFANDLVGFMIHDTAAPVGRIFYTINGGFNWQLLSGTPTNAGLNSLYVCGPDLAYTVGEASGGTGVVLRVAGSGS